MSDFLTTWRLAVPELPEVENVAQALRDNLTGSLCTDMSVGFSGVLEPSPRAVRRAVVNRTLLGVQRHGKYLVLDFDGSRPSHVMLHLRMTGQVFVLDGYIPDKHVHLVFQFGDRTVHYRDIRKFGRWSVVGPDWRDTALAHVGPDMLKVQFNPWLERVKRRRTPMKSVLLDQGVAAGMGNIYADEALFRAGIHPLTHPAGLSREALHRVLRESRAVLRLAIHHGGTTFLNFTDFHGRPGNFRRKLRVYGRAGEACGRCGATIERLIIGGRSSCYCPECQPQPLT